MKFLIIFLLLGLLAMVGASPSGAPSEACDSMTPGHPGQPQPLASSPYKLQVSDESYSPGDTLIVTIQGPDLRGLLLRVISDSGKPIGMFVEFPAGFRHADCSPEMSSVTHTSRDAKSLSDAKFVWLAPDDLKASSIKFIATIVKEFREFWVGVESVSVRKKTSEEHMQTDSGEEYIDPVCLGPDDVRKKRNFPLSLKGPIILVLKDAFPAGKLVRVELFVSRIDKLYGFQLKVSPDGTFQIDQVFDFPLQAPGYISIPLNQEIPAGMNFAFGLFSKGDFPIKYRDEGTRSVSYTKAYTTAPAVGDTLTFDTDLTGDFPVLACIEPSETVPPATQPTTSSTTRATPPLVTPPRVTPQVTPQTSVIIVSPRPQTTLKPPTPGPVKPNQGGKVCYGASAKSPLDHVQFPNILMEGEFLIVDLGNPLPASGTYTIDMFAGKAGRLTVFILEDLYKPNFFNVVWKKDYVIAEAGLISYIETLNLRGNVPHYLAYGSLDTQFPIAVVPNQRPFNGFRSNDLNYFDTEPGNPYRMLLFARRPVYENFAIRICSY